MQKRARIFIDYGATIEWWKDYAIGAARFGDNAYALDWSNIFKTVPRRLKEISFLQDYEIECEFAYVYAYLNPQDISGKSPLFKELRLELDQLPGFSVRIIEKQRKEMKCNKCPNGVGWIWEDKGLDTRIAVDILSGALDDHYDIAVLYSDSDELVPAVEVAQSTFNKRVVHVAKAGVAENLRAAAWAHGLFDLKAFEELAAEGGESVLGRGVDGPRLVGS